MNKNTVKATKHRHLRLNYWCNKMTSTPRPSTRRLEQLSRTPSSPHTLRGAAEAMDELYCLTRHSLDMCLCSQTLNLNGFEGLRRRTEGKCPWMSKSWRVRCPPLEETARFTRLEKPWWGNVTHRWSLPTINFLYEEIRHSFAWCFRSVFCIYWRSDYKIV